MENSSLLSDAASFATIFGLPAGIIAVIIAIITLNRTNNLGSASAVLAFYQSASQGWDKVIQQHQAEKDVKFSVGELLNTLELGACLYHDRVFKGEVRDLLSKYIKECMNTIDGVPEIRKIKSELMTGDAETFKFLVKMRFGSN
ncbi:hypothetical protein [Azospirillum sp. B2RO_4]|uniref:hypothetical protein n=1 Tax=Azospirillum sp. B2RO_4 TaxID=3027796 RepID=UPI003DAA1B0D